MKIQYSYEVANLMQQIGGCKVWQERMPTPERRERIKDLERAVTKRKIEELYVEIERLRVSLSGEPR
jgi:hypothetical protein